jgi:hypothetical protein
MRQGLKSLAGFGRMKQPCPTGGKKEGKGRTKKEKNFPLALDK